MAKYNLVLDASYKNRNLFFAPVNGNLAGEMRVENIKTSNPPGAINAIGGALPGHRVMLDTKTGEVRVIDRLKLKENESLLAMIRKMEAARDVPQYIAANFDREDAIPDFEGVLDAGDKYPANMATWLWHLKRMFEAGKFQLVSTDYKWPSDDEIKAMGPIFLGDLNGLSRQNGRQPNIMYPPGKEPKGTPSAVTSA